MYHHPFHPYGPNTPRHTTPRQEASERSRQSPVNSTGQEHSPYCLTWYWVSKPCNCEVSGYPPPSPQKSRNVCLDRSPEYIEDYETRNQYSKPCNCYGYVGHPRDTVCSSTLAQRRVPPYSQPLREQLYSPDPGVQDGCYSPAQSTTMTDVSPTVGSQLLSPLCTGMTSILQQLPPPPSSVIQSSQPVYTSQHVHRGPPNNTEHSPDGTNCHCQCSPSQAGSGRTLLIGRTPFTLPIHLQHQYDPSFYDPEYPTGSIIPL
ncbi:hypothetical protein C8Q75DRAFT_536725 [Abortiporus biennis]|nr:hypothetical protein C8Q75DRAFT_536725 [Abortiporus biennis]